MNADGSFRLTSAVCAVVLSLHQPDVKFCVGVAIGGWIGYGAVADTVNAHRMTALPVVLALHKVQLMTPARLCICAKWPSTLPACTSKAHFATSSW